MKITQCQLPGHVFMFETPLEVAAQLLVVFHAGRGMEYHRSEIFHAGR
jgi:hypothetical protein